MPSRQANARSIFSNSKQHGCPGPQRFCGKFGLGRDSPVIRQFCIACSAWLSQAHLRCSTFWADISEALNLRVPLQTIRKRKDESNGRDPLQ